MLRYRLKIWALALISVLVAALPAAAQSITGSGRASSKEEALLRAQKEVSAKAVYKMLRTEDVSADFLRLVESKAADFCSDYTELNSEALGSGWSVEIEASIASLMKNMASDEDLIKSVFDYMERPDFMLFVNEVNPDGLDLGSFGNWTETNLSQDFTERNFTVIDRQQFDFLKARDVALKTLDNPADLSSAIAKMYDQGVEFFVRGTTTYEGKQYRTSRSSFWTVTATFEAEIYSTNDGRKIASNSERAVGKHVKITAAGERASELVAAKMSVYLFREMFRKFALEMAVGSPVSLVVNNINFRGVKDLKSYLETLPQVAEVNFRSFRAGTQEVDLLLQGDFMEFAFGFDGVALPSGLMAVEAADQNTITVNFKAGEGGGQVVTANIQPGTVSPAAKSGASLPYIGTIDIEKELPKTREYHPDNVAVVIGNANYQSQGKGVPDVSYAHRDADFMKKYLIDVLGYEEGNIIEIKDATYSDMANVFGNERVRKGKLANMVKPGVSEVFVFYSGHGAPDADTKEGYLIPVNADPASVKISGYPTEVLYENLSMTDAKFTTVVLDACFSGGSGSGEMLVKNASPLAIKIQNPASKLKKGAIFTASSGDQIASWYPDMQMGLFTYQYVKGLQGSADLNGDKKVTVMEMKSYLGDNTKGVPYLARKLHNRVQTPQVFSEESENVIVSYQ